MNRNRPIAKQLVAQAFTVIVFAAAALCPAGAQIDPRASGACELPELGRMVGTLQSKVGNWGEDFGMSIHAVGDVNGDDLADWLLLHRRVDTPGFSHVAEELLLYHGRRGGLPSIEDGVRIGPKEIGSRTRFVAAGDFDGDGYRDIVLRNEVFGDTTGGNSQGFQMASLAVYWGNATGAYTNRDTTRLSCGAQMWAGPALASSVDLDMDGIDDLLVYHWEGVGLSDGTFINVPRMMLFRGGPRWGSIRPRLYDWQWWTPPRMTDLKVVDHDGDAAPDVAMMIGGDPSITSITVMYGTRGVLHDTSNVESVPLAIANGRESAIIDLTGDRIPELVLSAGSQEKLKIFVGIRGQRLIEQYGSGYDAPRPGEARWWGRPWAEIWLPYKFSQAWTMAGFIPPYDLGDVGLDGAGDVCVDSRPWLVCYNGGGGLDSLVDALIRIPGHWSTGVAMLGNIDGSDVNTIAVGYADLLPFGDRWGPGGIRYVKASRCVPRTGTKRLLPKGTDTPSSIDTGPATLTGSLAISLVPNPATDRALLHWPQSRGTAIVTVTDTHGAELKRWQISAGSGALTLEFGDWPRGAYRLTLSTTDGLSAIPIILR